ncbi:hypothetical protein IB274_21775 [Pseudomonas sp. PDM18]|uniref:hypothetical protein n=1 Tax=unclassified Pseudomonas TaxID=196821 RepID=UPI0017846A2E|nr:hypothetical protein [Pseudomonas sp. PDM18]MBD9679353.1 hypothetical protein [Pseudomonas sp. PDM18]
MPGILVEIVRYTEECFPGWAECRLIDSDGRDWRFLKKRSAVIHGPDDGRLPASGRIACEVLERLDGTVLVSTVKPRGIRSLDGENRFRIPVSALHED